MVIFAPNGKRRSVLPHTRSGGVVQWSADGSRLLFGFGGFYVVRADGSHRRRVLRDAFYAAWSPDGKTFAVTFDSCKTPACDNAQTNPLDIYTTSADGREVHRLTFNATYDGEAAWSPDGRRLAYATEDGIFVMDPDGVHKQRLTRNGYQEHPAWSPDGKRVAFDNAVDVFVVDVETRGVRKLTHNPGPDRSAAWSPDGRFLAYLSERACARCFSAEDSLELWVMRSNGTHAHRLARGRGYGPPSWGLAR